jgi:hypothetical protein
VTERTVRMQIGTGTIVEWSRRVVRIGDRRLRGRIADGRREHTDMAQRRKLIRSTARGRIGVIAIELRRFQPKRTAGRARVTLQALCFTREDPRLGQTKLTLRAALNECGVSLLSIPLVCETTPYTVRMSH